MLNTKYEQQNLIASNSNYIGNKSVLFTAPKKRIRSTLGTVHCCFEHIKYTANDRVFY